MDYKYNQNINNIHLKTIYVQRKVVKYRNMQYMSKNGQICKNMQNKTLYFGSILTIIQTDGLPS